MKVLLHIGSPKAGSTSLQVALRSNAVQLEKHDVYCWVPDQKFGNFARALSNKFRKPHQRLTPFERRKLGSLKSAISWSNECWSDISKQVKYRKPPLTILSSETLFPIEPKTVLQTLSAIFDEVTIIAYVRDPAEHFRSAIDQLIRGGARVNELPIPSKFCPLKRCGFQQYSELLGANNVKVRNLHVGNLFGGDVVTDFANQVSELSGTKVEFQNTTIRSNESLSAPAIAWLLSANETFNRFPKVNDPIALQMRFDVIKKLRESKSISSYPKLSMNDQLLKDLVRHSSKSVIKLLNDKFLNGQIPLPLTEVKREVPSSEVQTKMIKDWIFSQVSDEQMCSVVEELLNPLENISDAVTETTDNI